MWHAMACSREEHGWTLGLHLNVLFYFVLSLSKGNGLFGTGGLVDGCTHHIHRVRRRSVICQLSHNVFMAHKSSHMNRRESRLPEIQKYAALKHWERHAKANITSFQNAHVVFQNNSISD